ncbi:MAG: polysaccharide deacetylase family protein [Deltaproteobacteria bacterium]|nr:polysaccharide deacetylase family protein [Deltaproteobacteria bacterium]
MPAPLVSVSVDLDAIACYHRIHALDEVPDGEARFAILRRALPRLGELFAKHGIRATLFAVGRDLEEDAEGARILADLAKAGHEIASHSYSHLYDLVRRPREEMAAEIDRAHAAIAAVAGRAPVGFRAPGYEISAGLIDLLCERGYRYDSSTFPAIPYYLAKAAVMAAMRLSGRKSSSILGSARVLGAPCAPYRPAAGAPYRRGDLPIVELPITVTPGLRLHVIGTTLVISPEWLRRRLAASALGTKHFNLELHGIDLADGEADGILAALARRQPDLRVPLARKRAALERTLGEAQAAGARFLTLAEAATEFAH